MKRMLLTRCRRTDRRRARGRGRASRPRWRPGRRGHRGLDHRQRRRRRRRGSGRGEDVLRRRDSPADRARPQFPRTRTRCARSSTPCARPADASSRRSGSASTRTPTRPEGVNGYSASNSVSAVSDVADAPALIDAAAEAGANQISGPGLSSSNAEALYRQALAKAVDEARLMPRRSPRPRAVRSARSRRSSRAALRRPSPVPRGSAGRGLVYADRSRRARDVRDGQRHLLPPLGQV